MLVLYVPDSFLSLFIQLFTMIYILIASPRNRKGTAIWHGAFFMLLANIVGQIVVAGGGPGACVGMVALPTLGMMLALVSLSFSEWWKWVRKKLSTQNSPETVGK